jgi:hypothetical protein
MCICCTVYLLYGVFVVLFICCIVYLLYCVFVVLCICCTVYLLYRVFVVLCICCTVCIDVVTLDAGLLASSQYSEGPANGHLDTAFFWFPCVFKQMLRWFPTFQVVTTCFSCSKPISCFVYCAKRASSSLRKFISIPPKRNEESVVYNNYI